MWKNECLALLVLASAGAFRQVAPRRGVVVSKRGMGPPPQKGPPRHLFVGRVSRLEELSVGMKKNLKEGVATADPTQLSYVVGQMLLILCVLIGGVPFVGGILEAVAGPGCLVVGLTLIATGIFDLGAENLTPFAAPVEDGRLKTNGIYALSRHPMYTGVLLGAFGLSVVTHSFQRVVAAALLYVLLDAKANLEEQSLAEKFAAYEAYTATVPKFFPDLQAISSAIKGPGDVPP